MRWLDPQPISQEAGALQILSQPRRGDQPGRNTTPEDDRMGSRIRMRRNEEESITTYRCWIGREKPKAPREQQEKKKERKETHTERESCDECRPRRGAGSEAKRAKTLLLQRLVMRCAGFKRSKRPTEHTASRWGCDGGGLGIGLVGLGLGLGLVFVTAVWSLRRA